MKRADVLMQAVVAMGRVGSVVAGAVLELQFVSKLRLKRGVVRNAVLASRRRDLEGRV